MAKITEEQVTEALTQVIDPELHMDVISLGLVYGIEISDDNVVTVKLTMTVPGCPLQNQILYSAEQAILGIEGAKDAVVQLVWEPPWNPAMMNDEAKKRLGF